MPQGHRRKPSLRLAEVALAELINHHAGRKFFVGFYPFGDYWSVQIGDNERFEGNTLGEAVRLALISN